MSGTVLQVIDSLAAGGAERVAVNLANALSRRGYDARLCATRATGPLLATLAAGVEVLELRRRHRFDARAIARLAAYLRAEKVSVVHAHGSALFVAELAAAFSRARVVWHAHTPQYPSRPAYRWAFGVPARRAHAVIAVSEPLDRWVREVLAVRPDRAWHIANFVSAVPATPVELPGRRGLRIACVANFRPQKDHPGLLAAFAEVVRAEPEATLLLLGTAVDAEYVRAVRAAIATRGLERSVAWLGYRADVPAVLAGCDVGVLASSAEGLPMALLEYGAAGLASVCTAVGECAEVLASGAAGVLVPPRDPQALASALLALLRDPSRRAVLGSTLRARVEERYGAEAAVTQVCEVYARVLA